MGKILQKRVIMIGPSRKNSPIIDIDWNLCRMNTREVLLCTNKIIDTHIYIDCGGIWSELNLETIQGPGPLIVFIELIGLMYE